MPDIEWRIDPEFRRAVAAELARWDFRVGPEFNLSLFKATYAPWIPTENDVAARATKPHVTLKVDVEVKVADGHSRRTFVVRPKSPEDERLIEQWVEERKRSRAWLREGEVS